MVLPALTLGIFGSALYARLLREELGTILGQDFVRTARAKGAAPSGSCWCTGCATRSVPVATIAALELGALVGGAVVTERLFRWPGVGQMAVEALLNRDAPVIFGTVLFAATAVVAATLVLDLVYALLDPRLRRPPPFLLSGARDERVPPGVPRPRGCASLGVQRHRPVLSRASRPRSRRDVLDAPAHLPSEAPAAAALSFRRPATVPLVRSADSAGASSEHFLNEGLPVAAGGLLGGAAELPGAGAAGRVVGELHGEVDRLRGLVCLERRASRGCSAGGFVIRRAAGQVARRGGARSVPGRRGRRHRPTARQTSPPAMSGCSEATAGDVLRARRRHGRRRHHRALRASIGGGVGVGGADRVSNHVAIARSARSRQRRTWRAVLLAGHAGGHVVLVTRRLRLATACIPQLGRCRLGLPDIANPAHRAGSGAVATSACAAPSRPAPARGLGLRRPGASVFARRGLRRTRGFFATRGFASGAPSAPPPASSSRLESSPLGWNGQRAALRRRRGRKRASSAGDWREPGFRAAPWTEAWSRLLLGLHARRASLRRRWPSAAPRASSVGGRHSLATIGAALGGTDGFFGGGGSASSSGGKSIPERSVARIVRGQLEIRRAPAGGLERHPHQHPRRDRRRPHDQLAVGQRIRRRLRSLRHDGVLGHVIDHHRLRAPRRRRGPRRGQSRASARSRCSAPRRPARPGVSAGTSRPSKYSFEIVESVERSSNGDSSTTCISVRLPSNSRRIEFSSSGISFSRSSSSLLSTSNTRGRAPAAPRAGAPTRRRGACPPSGGPASRTR